MIDNADNPKLDEEAVGKGALLLRLCVDSIAGVGGIVWIAEGPANQSINQSATTYVRFE